MKMVTVVTAPLVMILSALPSAWGGGETLTRVFYFRR
jgi:hypothetical protein